MVLGRHQMKRIVGRGKPIEVFQVSFSEGKLCRFG